MKNLENRNKYYFGLGTVGRDMFYAFEANTMVYFLSDVLSLPLWVFATVINRAAGTPFPETSAIRKQRRFSSIWNTS